ncbi:Cadmium-induced protein as8-like [Quillaja saponaria]|uniref:Cadmium-induced protein as8-like n=1 Tax=Quillaja saponaria TaxID=32244 RepID=A0AAD7L909_QUISA|nr:Cadmium-induced protein as8-like [Quillaja saponaria]
MVLMIIKGLCRRYERWNPVHPTSGAFWGMGVGIGCGVGWGPGFGPEVIGYVGAGCGIGFNVGITLAGIGIGLPANFIFQAPCSVFMATRSSALELARSSGVLSSRDVVWDGFTRIAPCITALQKEASEKFSRLRQNHFLIKGVDFIDMKNRLPVLATSACESLRSDHFFHSRKVIHGVILS